VERNLNGLRKDGFPEVKEEEITFFVMPLKDR
jgi:hypothetical protein